MATHLAAWRKRLPVRLATVQTTRRGRGSPAIVVLEERVVVVQPQGLMAGVTELVPVVVHYALICFVAKAVAHSMTAGERNWG